MKLLRLSYWLLISWVLVLTNPGAYAKTSESKIELEIENQVVRGTLTKVDQKDAPIVILVHGFTGDQKGPLIKDTEDGVFQRMTKHFTQQNMSVFAFDFLGHGVSDGKFENFTYERMIKTATIVFDWIKEHPDFENSKIAMAGWSQGGLISSHVAAKRPELDALILLAPLTNPLAAWTAAIGWEKYIKFIGTNVQTIHEIDFDNGQPPVKINTKLFQELAIYQTTSALAHYKNPLLVIMAEHDDIIRPQPYLGDMYTQYHRGKTDLLILDTDHVWSYHEGPEVVDLKLIPAINNWLAENLN